MPIYTDEEYSLERNGHWTENVDIGSHSDGKHCAGQEWNPLKPVGKTADKDKSVDKGGEAEHAYARNHEYLTLKSQPENAEKGGVLLPAQLTQGRDLHQDGHGREQVDVSLRQAVCHVVDECARDSDPYYSEIKEGDESLSGSDGSCLQQNDNLSDQKGTDRPISYGDDKGGEAEQAHARNHQHLTLESQPENAEKGGVLLPAQLTQGRDLHQDGHGREQVDVSLRQAACHVVDECARDSDPYYSEIKEGDESLSGSDGSCLQQNNKLSDQNGTDKPISYGDDKGGEAEQAHARNHQHLTLESQPENAEKGGVLLPAQLTQGRDLHQDGYGREQVDVSLRQAACHVVDECARDSDPYYSKIKEGDESLSGSDGSCLQQKNNRSNQKGDYEVVDFESDDESSTELKLKAVSLKSTGPGSASLSNDDEMFMVDNVAYESADDVVGDTRHKNVRTHDKGVDGLDDDVMMMVDNVTYESSVSLQNTDSHQTGHGVQPSHRNAANDNDDSGNDVDDELIMVENAAYESTASLQHTDSH